MRSPQTLRGRLALSALGTAAVAVLLLTTLFALLLERRLDSEARSVLRSRVEAGVATVEVLPGGRLQVAEGGQDTLLDTGLWIFQGTTVVEEPRRPGQLQDTALSLAGTADRIVETHSGPPFLFLSMSVQGGSGQAGTVVGAISLDPYRRSGRTTVVGAVVLGVLLVALVGLVARRVAKRALAPVADMTQQASAWSEGGASLRFGAAKRPGELQELATNLDTLLDRLAAVLRREQQLSAEISHELRTPLAGIAAEADLFLTRARTTDEAARAMAGVAEGARRMERILDTLLAAARAETVGSGRSNAVEVVRALGAEVASDVDVPFVGVFGDLVERVMAPLLENAGRYSEHRGVRVRAVPEAVLLEVWDDGPGVPEGQELAVFEPGRRLNPGDDHDGAGLGLVLARRLARASGGEIVCVPGRGGCFVVTFPKA